MNENFFYALCGSAVCNELSCDQCREVFGRDGCPIDLIDSRHDLVNYVKKLMGKLNECPIDEFTDSEILDLLMGE
jgi:hypothetical protein